MLFRSLLLLLLALLRAAEQRAASEERTALLTLLWLLLLLVLASIAEQRASRTLLVVVAEKTTSALSRLGGTEQWLGLLLAAEKAAPRILGLLVLGLTESPEKTTTTSASSGLCSGLAK